jgi:FkbM family methyltransferase
MLKSFATAILPRPIRQTAGVWVRRFQRWKTALILAWWRRKASALRPGSWVRWMEYTVRINDGPNYYVLYKDLIVKQIYRFEALRPDPCILDCGSNIGLSILYFKRLYPKARIIGFEPDPAVLHYLQDNVSANGLTDVKVVQAAVGGKDDSLTFYSDGKYGSCLAHLMPGEAPQGWTRHQVPCVRLRDYLTEPVDFMKMNIEGAEWEALADSEDRLRLIREMIIEYHHLPGLPRTLHRILELLDRQGFEYLINDFDVETNAGVQPPFQLAPSTSYFLLIYAKRTD